MKILKKDFLKNKGITTALVFFIFMSALLIACGTSMLFELHNSLNYLFEKSNVPHFLIKHSGKINQSEIELWSANNPWIKNKQIIEMVDINRSDIYLNDSKLSEYDSVMNIAFVKQNTSMDLLLNQKGQIIELSKGEIAVPLYYMQLKNMKIGDKVRVTNKHLDMSFIVVDFVRDALMNPALVHSKRFVISNSDFETLKQNVKELEYFIEFQLTDTNKLNEFRNTYEASDLPQNGPMLDFHLLKILNAISDGIIAAMLLLISILLTLIAILCIRFTILTTVQEDYKEIGVMKAIGILQGDIKKIYIAKYFLITTVGIVLGYFASLFLKKLFLANILFYLGSAPKTILLSIGPVAAVMVLFIVMIFFCALALRKINKISPIEALRSGIIGEAEISKRNLFLYKNKLLPVNIFLGIHNVYQQLRKYIVLFLIFFFCSFIIIVPVNFLNTIKSPNFITYMGIGRSDIRIDLRKSQNILERFNTLVTFLKNDPDVAQFSPEVTSQFKMINDADIVQNINIQTGDFSKFPLEYLEGSAPKHPYEIALSLLYSKELKKNVGDKLRLIIDNQEENIIISGIYQDITGGGLTAKAHLPFNFDTALWYVINVNLKPNTEFEKKIEEYIKIAHPTRVSDLETYVSQTLGNTIKQLTLLTFFAIIIALFIVLVITYLFLKLILANEWSQIAIMRAIGFTLNDIRLQYITRVSLVLLMGVTLGILIANTLGQYLVDLLWSFLGASNIKFVTFPLLTYFFIPLTVLSIVTITALTSMLSLRKATIIKITQN
ncbi:MAG: FtsX-like permease family protein [Candidatus Babeliales bacterium]